MKKFLFIIISMAALASCNVLDIEPQNSIPAEVAFKDKAGIEKGILGAYSSFQNLSYYGRSYLIFSDLAADNLDHPSDATALEYAQVDNNAILPENASVEGLWSSGYESINAANSVIVQVPGMADMTDGEKNQALGELYFIRALSHFNLINYFGGIPVKTIPTTGNNTFDVKRNTVAEVYQQIITDLTFAENNLAISSPKNRASRYAAKALLARVYLYQGNYAQAKVKATEVIESKAYELLDDFAAIFTDASAESVFEIDFTELRRNRIAEYNLPKALQARREVAPSANLLSSFEPDDIRPSATIAVLGGQAYSTKYDDLAKGADNVIVLRLAEMYLIRAEAEARLQGDIDAIRADIDEVRARAHLQATTASTYGTLLTAIEKERRAEFAFEGHRWFDLVRTGRAVDVLPKVTNINQTLFPVPLSEIITNRDPDMKQNPGY
jgi:starch-binding outer membrane protein, SusD/RagB family